VLVAEQGGQLIGVGIGYETVSGDLSLTLEARRTGYVSDLVVQEAWRGKGVGRDLLNGLLARFRARGLKTARIGAISENVGAIKLYERMGFSQVSVAMERPL
jgi:ribosomal-protein-alanine N-acetyltransferase